MNARITNRLVEGLGPGALVWDADVKGFAARRQQAAKVYLLKTRIGGRQRWITIGRHGSPWTAESARREARRLLGEVAAGRDPAGTREAARSVGTLAEFADRYLTEYAARHKKPRSRQADEVNLRLHIVPALGRRKLTEIARADVARLHHELQAVPIAANRCVALLSKMFNLAELWGMRPEGSNPCRRVKRYRENRLERFLCPAELGHLGAALAEAEAAGTVGPYASAAIRLLVLTGARLGEILTLEWRSVDLDRGMILLADSKTGRKPLYLSPPAVEVLAGLSRQEGNPFVICGERPGAHLVNLQSSWRRVKAAASLDGVRIHDLRHSFASVAAAGGLSLPVIGRLLGHTQAATTARYAHLADDPLRVASAMVGRRIDEAMQGLAGGEADVVPLRRR